MTPTPEAIVDALEVAALGGDLGRLAAVCLDQSSRYQDAERQRLLDAAAALSWANQILVALDTATAMPGTSGTA
jgi:2C-methyl-D-erythritol 2,4-cyclodiphosphate synthase